MASVEKIYLGHDAEEIHSASLSPTYSIVTVNTGATDEYGLSIVQTYPLDDTIEGPELVVDCPWITDNDSLAKDLYELLKDYTYQSFEALDAVIDPALEVGDSVSLAGLYGMIANRTIYFERLFTADISAPDKAEEDDEYPYTSSTKRTFDRIDKSFSSIKTSLTVTNGKIESIVSERLPGITGQMETITSTITQLSNEISLVVTSDGTTEDGKKINAASIKEAINADNGQSSIKLNADVIDLSSYDYVSFSDLSQSGKKTVIRGDYITTGTIDASRVRVSNSFQVLIDKGGVTSEGESILEPAGYIGAATGSTSVVVWFDGVEEYDENGNVIKHGTVGTVKGYKTATTYGVAMSASTDRVTENTRDPYVIVTDKGARISAGGAALLVTNGAVMYRHNSNDEWQKVGSGTATFG